MTPAATLISSNKNTNNFGERGREREFISVGLRPLERGKLYIIISDIRIMYGQKKKNNLIHQIKR